MIVLESPCPKANVILVATIFLVLVLVTVMAELLANNQRIFIDSNKIDSTVSAKLVWNMD